MRNQILPSMRLNKHKYGAYYASFYLPKDTLYQISQQINIDKWKRCLVIPLGMGRFYIVEGTETQITRHANGARQFHVSANIGSSVGEKSIFSLPVGAYKIIECFGESITFEAIYCKI